MRLDSDNKLFSKYIEDTSGSFNISAEYVEKDYWLVLILKCVLSNDDEYVFKGGTSLSKCFHLINRFSEDIDISYSVSYSELGSSNINKKFKGITRGIKAAGLEIENKDDLRRSAYFNQFKCPYPSNVISRLIDNKIIIELAGQTPSFPSEKKYIQSFIGEYLESINRHDLVELYELKPFEINVQKLERTLIDKTFALCDYYLSNKCKRHSRHIYDIHKILTVVDLNQELANLYREVRNYRKDILVCYSAKDDIKLSDVLTKIIEEKSYQDDFDFLTAHLLYEAIKYSECELSLIKLRDFCIKYGL